jgi:3-oxoadipate enol-lactonase
MPLSFSLNTLADGAADRPTLVFLPGALIPPCAFEAAAKLTGCKSVGVDWMEGDQPLALPALAEALALRLNDLGPVVLVGHSVGTPLAALIADCDLRDEAPLVRGMVLSNSGANTRGHGDIDAVIAAVIAEWGPELWARMTRRSVGSPLDEALQSAFAAYPRRLHAQTVASIIRSQQQTDLVPLLPSLGKIPTVVVHGKHDPARTLAHAEELASGIPNARLVVLETGHTSCVEAPSAFADIVGQLVDTL